MASRVKVRKKSSNRNIDFAKLLVMGIAAINLYHSLLVITPNEAQDTPKVVIESDWVSHQFSPGDQMAISKTSLKYSISTVL